MSDIPEARKDWLRNAMLRSRGVPFVRQPSAIPLTDAMFDSWFRRVRRLRRRAGERPLGDPTDGKATDGTAAGH
jgi:hypothetical protein